MSGPVESETALQRQAREFAEAYATWTPGTPMPAAMADVLFPPEQVAPPPGLGIRLLTPEERLERAEQRAAESIKRRSEAKAWRREFNATRRSADEYGRTISTDEVVASLLRYRDAADKDERMPWLPIRSVVARVWDPAFVQEKSYYYVHRAMKAARVDGRILKLPHERGGSNARYMALRPGEDPGPFIRAFLLSAHCIEVERHRFVMHLLRADFRMAGVEWPEGESPDKGTP